MNFGIVSSLWFGVAAVFLVITGAGEWANARSKGASSWERETSFAALQLRAQGKLKIGLGIGFFALGCAGSLPKGEKFNPDEFLKEDDPLASTTTPEPPLPKPPAAPLPKPQTDTSSASRMPVKPPTFKKG